jgi:hypothetical protein
MASYDPEASGPAADWLQIDEGERIELVSSYHRGRKISLPNAQLHAVIHVVVENQVARSVLAADLYELMQDTSEATGDAYRRYLERLQKLTAKNWHAG